MRRNAQGARPRPEAALDRLRPRRAGRSRRGLAALVVAILVPMIATTASGAPLRGFTAFPYDLSLQAIDRVHEVILPSSNLYAIHLGPGNSEECMPWNDLLADRPAPEIVRREWSDIRRRIPASHVVYVATTPVSLDFRSPWPACDHEGRTRPPVRPWRERLDHPELIEAYGRHAKRVVDFFRPRFLVLGIEISEIALRNPTEWSRVEVLFDRVYRRLKAEHPDLQIGMEFILQSLLLPRVATLVRPLVERSDFLCLSFYPYGSSLGVLHGAPPLPEPPDQWIQPLNWVRKYTSKPIAVCETGDLSSDVNLQDYGLRLSGDPDRQARFLRDLIHIAHRDRYLFLVWFVPVDYDRLYARLPKGAGWKQLWLHAGLFDKDLRPKPAWAVWQDWMRGVMPEAGPPTTVQAPTSETPRGGGAPPSVRLGFKDAKDLFVCSSGEVGLDEATRGGSGAVMRWQFRYEKDWVWCAREVARGGLRRTSAVRFRVRGDRESRIAIRLDESGGESFFAIVPVTREWREEVVSLANFGRDTSTRGNGRLEPDQVVRVVLADGAGLEGASGRQTIWVADLTFE